MKGLSSPWVSGTLVVIAIGFVYYNFKPMIDRRPRRSPAPAPAAAPSAPAPAATGARAAQKPKLPQRPPVAATGTAATMNRPGSGGRTAIDRPYITARLAEWLESPRRDPFLFNTAQESIVQQDPAAPSPVQQWKLKSVWRQSGDRRAVINDAIYREGDEIQGFLLERIDADEVWLRGTNGVESLTFDYRKPMPEAAVTNSASAAPAGTGPARNLRPDRMQRVEKFLLGPQSDQRRELNAR